MCINGTHGSQDYLISTLCHIKDKYIMFTLISQLLQLNAFLNFLVLETLEVLHFKYDFFLNFLKIIIIYYLFNLD